MAAGLIIIQKNQMKKIKAILFLFSAAVMMSAFVPRENITGEKILGNMYKRYAGKWYNDFMFTQTTENYRNDSLIKTSTWYEAIVFPDNFRISFGEIKDGNAMIQKKDSVFNFRKGKLARKGPRGEDLTFLLGGMYFIPFDSVKARMAKEGYDISKAHESTWEGKKAYVIGTATDDEKGNQLWIDKEKLIVVRFIKYDKDKEEGIFKDHKQFGKAWSETATDFFINDKLIQKEKYYDCKANTGIDMKLFDTDHFYQQ
jgi:hypothetical protein